MNSNTMSKGLLSIFFIIVLHQGPEFKLGVVHSLPTNEEGEQWTWGGEDNKEASGEESNNHDELCNQNDLKPKIIGSETTYNTIFIGKTLFIFCAYEDCDTPATVTWFKDTTRLEFDENNVSTTDERIKVMANGSLIIENLKREDTGVKYVCSVQNEHGRDTASAFVDVKSESKILSEPSDVPFQEGSDVTFNCSFQVDASLKDTTVVEWYKDGTKIDLFGSGNPTVNCEYCDSPEEDSDYSTQDPRIILHPNNSITIQDVTSDDVGVYLCRVNTGLTEKLTVEAGTLYTEGSWWWIVIVVLIIFLVLLLFAYLVTKYVRHLQKSGKYDVKGTKIKPNKPKKETIHEPIVLHL